MRVRLNREILRVVGLSLLPLLAIAAGLVWIYSPGLSNRVPDSFVEILSWGSLLAAVAGGAIAFFLGNVSENATTTRRVEAAERLAATEPQKTKPAWDVARITLEAYFKRNLRQIDAIFVLSAVVIIAGFALMSWGVMLALRTSNLNAGALVAVAGLLTQFIGGTFIVIYRSAIAQAIGYIPTLERINSVGMAMQILDTLNDEADRALSSKTKAELVKLLIRQVPAATSSEIGASEQGA